MAKTYPISNSKDKDAPNITVDANTSDADFAGFAKLGYDVAKVRKQIADDRAAE